MSTIRKSRALARLFTVAALTLAASSMNPALAAAPSCNGMPTAGTSTLLAPGSIEAWKMAKFPWLYLPRASAAPSTTHFPEPGSAEAVTSYKTQYLYSPRTAGAPTTNTTYLPEPGSAKAVMYYKTPYLMNRRPAVDSSCP